MGVLADRVRKGREQNVTAGGFGFTLRRPTDLQLGNWKRKTDHYEDFLNCVVDWQVKECDIVTGGGGSVPPFDGEAFREWIEDRLPVLDELFTKIAKMIEDYGKTVEATEGNS